MSNLSTAQGAPSRHKVSTTSLRGLWVAPHQADVILWPQQLHHEVQVLLLLLFLGPLPVVCLVPERLLFILRFLRWLRAGLSCITIVLPVLQSQDSPTQHCKALPGRIVGDHYGPRVLKLQGVSELLEVDCRPLPRESLGLDWRCESFLTGPW